MNRTAQSDDLHGYVPLTHEAASPDVLQAFKAQVPGVVEILQSGSGGDVNAESDAHACPGHLQHWIYSGSDGHTHVAWTVFYSCEGLLEILSDVAVI